MPSEPWIGVDLDGTLAHYDGWKGIEHIGEPIQPIVDFIKAAREGGTEVRILTARVGEGPEAIRYIEEWCLKHLSEVLPVTDRKDFSMIFLLDDRAIAVETNTGRIIGRSPSLR